MSEGKEKAVTKKRILEATVSDWVAANSKECRLITDNVRVIRFEKQITNIPSYDQDDETESTSSSSTQEPNAPDGGYGWVVVLASFLIHFICDGISFSYGIMFPEVQQNFDATKTMSGVVGSIFLSIPLLSGPLAGALTDIYDCRRMTIAGGLIAAGGAFISFFAFSIWHFILSFAFITGIGLSFCFNTAIVAVTYYFQKKRAIATGIAVCGSGAGTIVLAPFIETLFANYGWRVTLLCMGVLLSCLIGCGLMIKDLEWPHDTIEYKRKKFIEKTERKRLRMAIRNVGDDCSVFTVDFAHMGSAPRRAISLPAIPTYAIPYLQVIDQSSNMQSVKAAVNELQLPVSKSRSMGEFLHSQANGTTKERNLVPDVERMTQHDFDLQMPHAAEMNVSPGSSRHQIWSNESISVEAGDLTSNEMSEPNAKVARRTFCVGSNDNLADAVCNEQTHEELIHEKFRNIAKGTLAQEKGTKQPLLGDDAGKERTASQVQAAKTTQDVVPAFTSRAARNSCMVTSLGAAQGRVPAANVLNFRWKFEPFGDGMYRRVPSAPAIYFRRKRKRRTVQLSKMRESFLEWLSDTKLVLIVPEFSLFLISTFILYVFFDIPYVNFPEYAVENHNVTETEASYLVSGIGLTNMVSMLFCGIIADWSRTRRHIIQMYGIFITLAGLCVALAPFAASYIQLMTLCIGFGFFISANYTLSSVITLHVLCLYDFQTGYGILCLVEGLGNLIGPAMIGFIRDNLSGYDNIFLLGGAGTMISGFMVIAIDIFMRASDTEDEKHSVKGSKNGEIRTEYAKAVENGVVNSTAHRSIPESSGYGVRASEKVH